MTNMNRSLDHQPIVDAEWSVAEAKARFSEVVARARSGQPQRVTRYGKDEVVVVSVEDWEKRQPQPSAIVTPKPATLLELFSPLRALGGADDLADILDGLGGNLRDASID